MIAEAPSCVRGEHTRPIVYSNVIRTQVNKRRWRSAFLLKTPVNASAERVGAQYPHEPCSGQRKGCARGAPK
jgi:hypothetical protein